MNTTEDFTLSSSNSDGEDYLKRIFQDYQKTDVRLLGEYMEIRTFLNDIAVKYEQSIEELAGITRPLTEKEEGRIKLAQRARYYSTKIHALERHHHLLKKKLIKFDLLKYFK